MTVSACIPCRNNADTLVRCMESVRAQKVDLLEVLVVDDGSEDRSAEIAEAQGARVLRFGKSLGRGAVRARCIQEARGEFVLSCDATNILAADFATKALPWFEQERVAAVCGVIRGEHGQTAADRWRNRHLFKTDLKTEVTRNALLATYGVVFRKSAVLAVGNFAPELRFAEDADLGHRLLGAGWEVIGDPEVVTLSIVHNSPMQVLERYWRWNMDKARPRTPGEYLRHIGYACKVMAREDLRQKDLPAAALSLLSPHYPLLRKLKGGR